MSPPFSYFYHFDPLRLLCFFPTRRSSDLEEPVDGEVPALGVLARRDEADARRPAAVHVGVVGAEGRHRERNPVLDHQDDAELRAHRHGAPEERAHDLGRRAGGDVEIEWLAPEELIAHAPAREVRLVSRLAEPPHDARGECSPVGHGPQSVARGADAGKRAVLPGAFPRRPRTRAGLRRRRGAPATAGGHPKAGIRTAPSPPPTYPARHRRGTRRATPPAQIGG